MATWSGIRNKLERDYLAKSLKGRVTYFATSYTNAHDHIGRAAIRGGFDNHSFYQAFAEFDNQSIETSLESGNLLVRIYVAVR